MIHSNLASVQTVEFSARGGEPQVEQDVTDAAPPPPATHEEKMDLNKDRFDDLSNNPEKLDALLLSVFKKLDKDEDGAINQSELKDFLMHLHNLG